MSTPGTLGVLLVLLLGVDEGWTATAAPGTVATLSPNGPALPGKDLDVILSVSWNGRPEVLVPALPKVDLPDGASLRPTHTESTFDGERTVWRWEAVVRLPDSPGPWTVGPAEVPAASVDGAVRVTAPAIQVRPSAVRSSAQLVGQGIGSALSILALSLFGRWLWRRTVAAPDLQAKAALPALLRAAEERVPAGGAAAWEALLALRTSLDEAGMGHLPLSPRLRLESALDAARYGGEGSGDLTCSRVLAESRSAVRVALGARR
jgi:hypothetical protein